MDLIKNTLTLTRRLDVCYFFSKGATLYLNAMSWLEILLTSLPTLGCSSPSSRHRWRSTGKSPAKKQLSPNRKYLMSSTFKLFLLKTEDRHKLIKIMLFTRAAFLPSICTYGWQINKHLLAYEKLFFYKVHLFLFWCSPPMSTTHHASITSKPQTYKDQDFLQIHR